MRTPRNWKLEEAKAVAGKVKRLTKLGEVREEGQLKELLLMAQCLIVTGLPYQRTEARQLVRKARLGDGSEVVVTFTAGLNGVEMPYGSDRTLLHWMVDRAIRAKSPFVSWDTAKEFLQDAGMNDAGKNYRDLRARYLRLSGLAIGVQRRSAEGNRSLLVPIIEEANLPSSVEVKAEQRGQKHLFSQVYGFQLNERFFREVMGYHVPVPWQLVRDTRRQSQLQDLMVFLHWRAYGASSPCLIPWENLRGQLWQEDGHTWRVKDRFKEALLAMKSVDPAFPGEIREEGLWVVPYRKFLEGGAGRKRLPTKTNPVPEP
jgi:hypothetical protein